jgi:hypothetical protein
MNIDELLASLKSDHADCAKRASDAHSKMLQIEARIQGIEETREALRSNPVDNGCDYEPLARKPRRDIRALVRDHILSHHETLPADRIAADIGCKKSQVEAALVALRHEEEEAEIAEREAST